MQQLIATRPLPTLGVAEGQTFTRPPGEARRLVAKGLADRVVIPPRRHDDRTNPGVAGPLAWFPDWRGKTVVVVASGESAKGVDLELARDRPDVAVVVVNNSWRLAPWAAALYACDGPWWMLHAGELDFAGLKVTQDATAAMRFGLRRVTVREATPRLLMAEAGVLGVGSSRGGGNSGFQAFNWVLQCGASRVPLVGFDMKGGHWHGRHPARLNNPSVERLAHWAETLDGQAQAIADLGVEVLNCSPVSALAAFPKTTLAEALGA